MDVLILKDIEERSNRGVLQRGTSRPNKRLILTISHISRPTNNRLEYLHRWHHLYSAIATVANSAPFPSSASQTILKRSQWSRLNARFSKRFSSALKTTQTRKCQWRPMERSCIRTRKTVIVNMHSDTVATLCALPFRSYAVAYHFSFVVGWSARSAASERLTKVDQ